MIQTQKKEGSFHTVMSRFGVSSWDEAIYIPAGLRIESNSSFRFYDYGDYPFNKDKYTRHLEFITPESPDFRELVSSGKALLQFIELSESVACLENSLGSVAVSALKPLYTEQPQLRIAS